MPCMTHTCACVRVCACVCLVPPINLCVCAFVRATRLNAQQATATTKKNWNNRAAAGGLGGFCWGVVCDRRLGAVWSKVSYGELVRGTCTHNAVRELNWQVSKNRRERREGGNAEWAREREEISFNSWIKSLLFCHFSQMKTRRCHKHAVRVTVTQLSIHANIIWTSFEHRQESLVCKSTASENAFIN